MRDGEKTNKVGSVSGCQKVVWKVLFFAFFSTALALGSSAIVKVLGQNDTFVFWGSLQQMPFASQQVLRSVHRLHLSQSPAVFSAKGCRFKKGSVEGSANYSLHLSPKWLLLHKSSWEVSANCALHLSPSLLLGSKLREFLTCLTHTNPVRRKRPIMSLLLRYSLGLFLLSIFLLPYAFSHHITLFLFHLISFFIRLPHSCRTSNKVG